MKKLTIFVLGSLLVFASSCKKDDTTSTTSSAAVSTDEAAQIVGASLASTSGGATDAMGEAAATSVDASSTLKSASIYRLLKDTSFTVSGTRINAAGDTVTFNNAKTYKLTLLLDSATLVIPQNLTAVHTCDGSVSALRYTETHLANGTFVYTNLVTVTGSTITKDSIWTMNGTYTRTGTHVIRSNAKTISHSTTITFTNLLINKKTKVISGGTATVTIAGSVKNKGSFTYTGTLVFNGSGVGTLTISGVSYLINLLTGNVTTK